VLLITLPICRRETLAIADKARVVLSFQAQARNSLWMLHFAYASFSMVSRADSMVPDWLTTVQTEAENNA